MVRTSFDLVVDVLHLVVLGLRSHARLAAENLFLRKQLALYVERQVQPRRAINATRLTLVGLARVIDWRPVLVYVFVVLDVGTRRLVHWNVTEHPTAAWVVQQFRTCVTGESTHRFIVYDRDSSTRKA